MRKDRRIPALEELPRIFDDNASGKRAQTAPRRLSRAADVPDAARRISATQLLPVTRKSIRGGRALSCAAGQTTRRIDDHVPSCAPHRSKKLSDIYRFVLST
jgi:hypothetical protein